MDVNGYLKDASGSAIGNATAAPLYVSVVGGSRILPLGATGNILWFNGSGVWATVAPPTTNYNYVTYSTTSSTVQWSTISHYQISDLQGGTTNEYYHLTNAQNASVASWDVATSSHNHAHNNLTSLQGGTTNEYYHLTNAEYTGTGTGNFVRQYNFAPKGTVTYTSGATLDVSAGTLALADNQISGDKVEGGTIAGVTITALRSTNIGIGVAAGTYPLHIKGGAANDHPTYSAEFLDADNWTSTDWTGSFAGGWAHTVGNTTVLSHDHAAVNSTYYHIEYTVTGTAGAGFTITFGGQTSPAITASGTWSAKSTSTGNLQITPATDFAGTIVISIKSITAASTAAVRFTDSAGTLRNELRNTNTTHCTLIGVSAGGHNTTANNNIAIGNYALQYTMTGGSNVAIGAYSLNGTISGTDNFGLGFYCMPYNKGGCRNVAIGSAVMTSGSCSGSDNIGIGTNSLFLSTSAYQNIAIGVQAGRTLTTGYTNAFFGYYAGYNANQKADAVNSMGLGANTFTNRSNQVVIGDANVVETQLRTGVYIGSTSTTAHTAPTARLHIAAGSASASTAPIKLTAGTLMTNPEAGAIEFDGTYLYFTAGATRHIITWT